MNQKLLVFALMGLLAPVSAWAANGCTTLTGGLQFTVIPGSPNTNAYIGSGVDASGNCVPGSILYGGATPAPNAVGNPLYVAPGTGAIYNTALNATPSLANGNGVVPTQGGAALSATNGGFQNILQGNAVLSNTNPLPGTITDGTNGPAAVKAASTAAVATDKSLVVQLNPIQPNLTTSLNVGPPAAAARHFPGCTVGTTSAQCLAGATAISFLQVQNNSGSSASVACAFGATAVLNSSTSFMLAAGQSASWGLNTGGVPSGAMNCISTASSTPLYVEYN